MRQDKELYIEIKWTEWQGQSMPFLNQINGVLGLPLPPSHALKHTTEKFPAAYPLNSESWATSPTGCITKEFS